MKRPNQCGWLLFTASVLVACDAPTDSTPIAVAAHASAALRSAVAPVSTRAPAPAFQMSPAALLGRSLFFDKSLSSSGTQACATCHDPDHAYGPPNDLAVQLGGPNG